MCGVVVGFLEHFIKTVFGRGDGGNGYIDAEASEAWGTDQDE